MAGAGGRTVNPRSLRNFPMQANGAEMLRIACCLATERGIEVCAPVHDAVLICAPLDRLDVDIAAMRGAMAEASRFVLAGFELANEVKVVHWPDGYADPRDRNVGPRLQFRGRGELPHDKEHGSMKKYPSRSSQN